MLHCLYNTHALSFPAIRDQSESFANRQELFNGLMNCLIGASSQALSHSPTQSLTPIFTFCVLESLKTLGSMSTSFPTHWNETVRSTSGSFTALVRTMLRRDDLAKQMDGVSLSPLHDVTGQDDDAVTLTQPKASSDEILCLVLALLTTAVGDNIEIASQLAHTRECSAARTIH
jgi:hypothetical protein